MKELPILMNTPMVKAIMEGTKTQTRRIINNPKFLSYPQDIDNIKGTNMWTDGTGEIVKCPYGTVGDILWVKETFYAYGMWEGVCFTGTYTFKDFTFEGFFDYHYEDNKPQRIKSHKDDGIGWYKRPSIFMPKVASRIKLLVTNVKIERLNDISETDAIAEGIIHTVDMKGNSIYKLKDYTQYEYSAVLAYKSLWQSINGLESWEDNPLVWVVEFKKID